MTDRELMQQALEALEWEWGGEPLGTLTWNAITALRERLAQPEQVPKWQGAQFDSALQSVPAQGTLLPNKTLMRRATREEKIDRPGVYWVPVEQEPVAWQRLDTGRFRKSLPASSEPDAWRPLYTAPPPNTIANSEAIPEQISEPVAAQHRFRRPQKGTPDWSVWQPCSVSNRPAWEIDSQGYEVEYRALYTTPQPRREWVGLTEEEIDQTVDEEDWYNDPNEFARAIEAKLKEKNT